MYVDCFARELPFFSVKKKKKCGVVIVQHLSPRFLPSNIVQLTLTLLVCCVTERILMSRNVFRRHWPLRGGGVNLGPNREQFWRPNREIFSTDGLFICNLPDIVAKLSLPSPTFIRFFFSVKVIFNTYFTYVAKNSRRSMCAGIDAVYQMDCCHTVFLRLLSAVSFSLIIIFAVDFESINKMV